MQQLVDNTSENEQLRKELEEEKRQRKLEEEGNARDVEHYEKQMELLKNNNLTLEMRVDQRSDVHGRYLQPGGGK